MRNEIAICAPSYKRPDKVDTLKYLPSTKIYIDEREYPEYRKHNPMANLVPVNPKHQGNLCRIRNKILDDHRNGIVCIIDDDLKEIACFENNQRIKLKTEAEVFAFLAKYTLVAEEMGVRLWGININNDKQCYREYTPFSLTSYIGGPFMVHIRPELRFDERLPLKEDYDFTLQHLNRYRRVLRVNKFYYVVKQVQQTGGCAVYRNIEREKEQLALLQKKWGKDIVRVDTGERNHKTTKERPIDINPVLMAPIKGV